MKWTRGPLIGRGSSATVSTAVVHPSGETLAVKSVELEKRSTLEREGRLHSPIRCPYIIEYKGQDVTVENGKPMYNIFMEFASFGSLAESIGKFRGLDSEHVVRSYTRSILSGLEYLHSRGIVHCDIKPSNILVTGNNNGGVKIGDLGCARLAGDVAGVSGTPVYMAPEVARGEQQGYPADVWALGCTVIEMVTGRAPWAGVSDPVSALYRIGFTGQVPEIPSSVSDEARDFLRKCLDKDPELRWPVNRLLGHPFVTTVNVGRFTKLPPGQGLCSGSPTSVLNSSPRWDESCSLTHDHVVNNPTITRTVKSPKERIQSLIELRQSLITPREIEDSIDPRDGKSCWVTVRSYRGKKGCFSDKGEVESESFEVERHDTNCNTNCTTFTTTIASSNNGNCDGELCCRTNFLQFDSSVNGFEWNCITICQPSYFGCVALCTAFE